MPTGSPARMRVRGSGLRPRGDHHRTAGMRDQPRRLELAPHPAGPSGYCGSGRPGRGSRFVELRYKRYDGAHCRCRTRVGPVEPVDDAEDDEEGAPGAGS